MFPLWAWWRLSGVPALGVVAASLVLTCAYIRAGWPHPVATLAALGPGARLRRHLGRRLHRGAFLVFFALIAEVGPLRAQSITYVNPAVALALGVALLGELFTVGAAVGFLLIVLGLLLATRRRSASASVRAQSWTALGTRTAGLRSHASMAGWSKPIAALRSKWRANDTESARSCGTVE